MTSEPPNTARDLIQDRIDTLSRNPFEHAIEERGTPRRSDAFTDDSAALVTALRRQQAFLPKRCYQNSQLAFRISQGTPRDVTYVEGLFGEPELGMAFQHAWVEHDGHVIDLTLTDDGRPDEHVAYHGIPIADHLVPWFIERETTTGSLIEYLCHPRFNDDHDQQLKMKPE